MSCVLRTLSSCTGYALSSLAGSRPHANLERRSILSGRLWWREKSPPSLKRCRPTGVHRPCNALPRAAGDRLHRRAPEFLHEVVLEGRPARPTALFHPTVSPLVWTPTLSARPATPPQPCTTSCDPRSRRCRGLPGLQPRGAAGHRPRDRDRDRAIRHRLLSPPPANARRRRAGRKGQRRDDGRPRPAAVYRVVLDDQLDAVRVSTAWSPPSLASSATFRPGAANAEQKIAAKRSRRGPGAVPGGR
jgi:hypothetical protein